MAEKENVNRRPNQCEPVVNRWFMDYCFHLAAEFFQKRKYGDFGEIRNLLTSLLNRPLEVTDATQLKIRVLQFMIRVNEVESLDVSFGADQISPLESALRLLESINHDFNIPQQDYKNVCTSIKELIVVTFIKREEFDKAGEMLNKHFPKPMVGKKALFMGLVKQKSTSHPAIQQVDLQQFREEILAFCQRICPFSVPFLLKAARIYLDKRLLEPDDDAAHPDEENEPARSFVPHLNISVECLPGEQTAISISRLAAAYKDLSAGRHQKSFNELEEEVETEEQAANGLSLHLSPTPANSGTQDSESDLPFQRDSSSPVEASPTDTQAQRDSETQTQAGLRSKTVSVSRKRRLFTVARLVVEPDSQSSSQCTITSQEGETEVRPEERREAEEPGQKDLRSPVMDTEISKPIRKHPRAVGKYCSSSEDSSSDSEEEESRSSYETPAENPACSSLRKKNRVSSPARSVDHTTKSASPTQVSGQGNSSKSKKVSSRCVEEPQESPASLRTPNQKSRQLQAATPCSSDVGNADEVHISDSSLDDSRDLFPSHPVPKTSSTPHKDSTQEPGPSNTKWKQLVKDATESKEDWPDEESCFPSNKKKSKHNESTSSNSSHRKKRWTESETQKLKDGVEKFGEGNWSKIKAYYSFKNRTNVNLKDRWRTMKRLNMI